MLTQLNVRPTVSFTVEPSNRKERKDNRVVKVLLSEKVQRSESAVAEKKVKARKSVISPEGAAITENGFFEEATKPKSKPPAKSPGDRTVKEKSVDKESAFKSAKKVRDLYQLTLRERPSQK